MATRSTPLVVLPALFLLSGVSGLIYETAWSRMFQDLFGHTVHTNAAVLAGFMAGLGLGAAVAGRVADRLRRPVRAYALLELSIVVLVWTSPTQVALVDRLLPAVAGELWTSALGGGILRWLAACALVVLPTSLMGATLPILCRALVVDDAALGRVFGWLYGLNTLGAVAGVVLAGGWLIRAVGVQHTLRIGCALGLVAGLGALAVAEARGSPKTQHQPDPAAASGPVVPPLILAAVFASGFAVLAAEVVWVRVFAFVLDSNVLSFTVVLASLLLALAIGSILLPRLVAARSRHLAALGWIQLAAGATTAATVVLLLHLDRLDRLIAGLAGGFDPLSSVLGRGLLAAAVLLVPGILMGAVLPAATGAIAGHLQTGRGVGALYAATTAGNIAGALAAGYLLIPALGSGRALVAAAAAPAVAGCAVLAWQRRTGFVTVATAATATTALVAWLWVAVTPQLAAAVAGRRNPHATTIAIHEGLRGTVTIADVPPLPVVDPPSEPWSGLLPVAAGYRMIAVDGVDVAGTSPDLRTTQKLQADVPLLLHGAARAVLQVGFGSGETTQEALRHGPLRYDVAELNPDVIRQAARWFPQFASTGFEAIITDARNWIRSTDRRYDVILNDSTYPGITGSSLLYSADHLAACRRHLAPGGLVSTWLPVDLPPESLRVVLASYRSVFPHVSFWLATNCLNKHGVLVGSLEPQGALMANLLHGHWPPTVRASLDDIGYGDPALLASARILDSDDIEALAAGAAINSDDYPILEYPARGVEVASDAYWRQTVRLILSRFGPPTPGPARDRLRDCVRRILEGELALLDGHPDVALEFYRRAALADPRHPGPARLRDDIGIFRAQAAFDEAAAAAAAGDADRTIARLQDAVSLCPRSAPARFELGRALLAKGAPVAALPHLAAAQVLAERIPEARLLYGDAALAAGQPKVAEAAYRSWLTEHPPQPAVLANLASAFAATGDIDEAHSAIEQARDIDPADPAVTRRLTELETELRNDIQAARPSD